MNKENVIQQFFGSQFSPERGRTAGCCKCQRWLVARDHLREVFGVMNLPPTHPWEAFRGFDSYPGEDAYIARAVTAAELARAQTLAEARPSKEARRLIHIMFCSRVTLIFFETELNRM